MGFFGRLFGKKDELGLDESLPGEDMGLEEGSPFPESPETAAPTELPPHLTEPATPTRTTPAQLSPRDIELLNSKLDTLKAILNSMDQRIANLEKAAGVEHKKMPW